VQNILTTVSPSFNPSSTDEPVIPCNVPHTLSFQIGGKIFPVDPRDFISPSPIAGDTTNCIVDNVVATDPPSMGALFSWNLGDPFFKSYAKCHRSFCMLTHMCTAMLLHSTMATSPTPQLTLPALAFFQQCQVMPTVFWRQQFRTRSKTGVTLNVSPMVYNRLFSTHDLSTMQQRWNLHQLRAWPTYHKVPLSYLRNLLLKSRRQSRVVRLQPSPQVIGKTQLHHSSWAVFHSLLQLYYLCSSMVYRTLLLIAYTVDSECRICHWVLCSPCELKELSHMQSKMRSCHRPLRKCTLAESEEADIA
jgi:hypothetical protein